MTRQTKSHYRGKQLGFTLVEMSIVVLILGLVTGAIFSFLSHQSRQSALTTNQARQKQIALALSDHAQMHGRLPCPAATNVNTDHANFGTEGGCAGVVSQGLVPFRVLGMSERDIYDSFGNPFTYAVSNSATSTAPATPVHGSCRTALWIEGGRNKNPLKAIFCCKSAPQQLIVTGNGTPVTALQSGVGGLGNVDALDTTPTNTTLAYMAYVLVSHGVDGRGAITPGTGGRIPLGPGIGAGESENANENATFAADRFSEAGGTGSFNDIVLWRTQQGVIRETGADSCARP